MVNPWNILSRSGSRVAGGERSLGFRTGMGAWLSVCVRAWVAGLALGLGVGGIPVPLTAATSGVPTSSQAKASLLFHFARYVEWPADRFQAPGEPIVIGLVGAWELEAELAQLIAGRKVGARPLAVQILRSEAEARGCHLVFLGVTDRALLAEHLGWFRNQRVMTIGESQQFLDLGGVINLTRVASKYRFDIDLGAVRREGLAVSSRLLDLASSVRK